MSGADEIGKLAADLTKAGPLAAVRARKAMDKALYDIERGAKSRAPVGETGALKGGISHETSNEGGTIRGEVGPTVNYAGYVENGTSRQRAQPYMRPATDEVLPGYQAALEQIGADILGGG